MQSSHRVQSCGAIGPFSAVVVASVLLSLPVSASVVMPMNLATLADHAGQVIVGQVDSVRSYWTDDPRRIETDVVFSGVEYLKGCREGLEPTFFLTVPGGTVGDMTLRLMDAPIFAVGERWLLFLLPQYKTHPVVGLNQGAFRIEQDADGTARVYDFQRRPVTGISAAGLVEVYVPAAKPDAANLVAAKRARVDFPEPSAPGNAMSHLAFLTQIRPVLERSKDHHLTHPAGRRALVQHRPVPFRSATGAAATATAERTDAARRAVPPGEPAEDRRGTP